MSEPVNVELTVEEAAALRALASGVGALAGRPIDEASAVVAAVELGLVRLIEDYELTDDAVAARRARVDARRVDARQRLPLALDGQKVRGGEAHRAFPRLVPRP